MAVPRAQFLVIFTLRPRLAGKNESPSQQKKLPGSKRV
ncbi:hypothetical protein EBI_26575 [Enterocytozoon bieneusi H348]|nr:hypothetical protein EBI_26575 [Enterocytozoon bieneusi H348]|eukprot:XP_002650732.1 hypothetical protein EBI_26575 [Enterocytozoon bieneusi H348]